MPQQKPKGIVYDKSQCVTSSITGTTHPVARTGISPRSYVFPWMIWNMPEGNPPTRLLVVANTLCGVTMDSGNLNLDNHMNVERAALVSGGFLFDMGVRVAAGCDSDDTYIPNSYMPHLTDDQANFLYDCIKWFEDAEKFPERIPDVRKKAGVTKK